MTSIIAFVHGVHPVSREAHCALRTGLVLLAGLMALAGAAPAAAQDHHPPVATLVKNLDQPSGPHIRTVLSKDQDGLMQGFRTGSNRGGYELESIWLYVRDTHESRYMTIRAAVYRDAAMRHRVATLTRGQMNDYAHNRWKAGPDTYLEPDTNYWFVLDCVSGCANDNWAQFGTTYHGGEDGGDEPGWSIHDRMKFRRPGDGWFRDNNEAMRIRVRGRPSPYRAYRTEIVSTPRDGRTYHYGEHIDIALTFSTAVYVPERGSAIAIRVGDTADGSNYRAAEYHSGSLTNRLVYRYQVQLGDVDTNGISVDAGGPNSGFGGTVPTIVASFGLLPVIDYYPGLADDRAHQVDGEFHVHDVAITSSPEHEDGYRVGDAIDVTVKFSIEAYATEASVLAIRVGDSAPGNYRPAKYVSGSGTDRLTYRYRVQLEDYDADGISVDAGGPPSGFGGTLPTTSPELGSVPVSRDFSRVPDDSGHKVDGSFRVTGVAITSKPEYGDTYSVAEEIEVTMNFSADAYTSDSVVAIRVGDSAPDNYRPARYVSGSGTDKLIYRYRVQPTDHDSDGVSIDVGGPPSGFGERVPTTSTELGSVPVDRRYPGVPDDAGHKVDGAVTVLFGPLGTVIAEGGPAVTVLVVLTHDPAGDVVIPITATPGGGATPADYTVAPTVLTFAPGNTRRSITVAAVDDREVDGGESVRLDFGTLPAGIHHGHQLTVFAIEDNDGFDQRVNITDVDGGTEPGSVGFTVTLTDPSDVEIAVDWSISDSHAVPGAADVAAAAGQDYVAASGTLTFAPGETERTVAVTVLDDAHDEGEETLTLRLSNVAGAKLADAEATGTIANSDPMPRAWLGRFGRTAFEHTLGAVDQRLRSARVPTAWAAVAGREVAAAGADTGGVLGGDFAWLAGGVGGPPTSVSGRELLAGSEFQVATEAGDAVGGGVLTLWGQGAYGRFSGQDDDLDVDGDVATGTLGVDYATGPWMVGLALSHSSGWGSYSRPMMADGEVTSSLTGAYPYVGIEVAPERLSLWVAGGYGLGGLRLVPPGGEPLETEIGMLAGAAGVRATLLPAAATGGLSLGLNADALLLRATAAATAGLAAETADVNRVRLGLEGLYTVALGGGAQLTPSVEVGVRRDGGDAETGLGMDVGGGLSFTHPGIGLSLGLQGRALVLNETADVAEWGASGWLAWDPNPKSELGPALTVSPSLGVRSEGGAQELWGRQTLAGLAADQMAANGAGRVDARVGYGMPLAGGVAVPWAGIGASEQEREYRLGYAFQAGNPSATDLRVELVGARREAANAEPEHTLTVHSTVRW